MPRKGAYCKECNRVQNLRLKSVSDNNLNVLYTILLEGSTGLIGILLRILETSHEAVRAGSMCPAQARETNVHTDLENCNNMLVVMRDS